MVEKREFSGSQELVELRRIELLTSAVRLKWIGSRMAQILGIFLHGTRNVQGTSSEPRTLAPDLHRRDFLSQMVANG